jgi:periplasmic divalent cation tolerance protein
MSYQLLLCTCPDAASAEHIAERLVEQQLAACVNIIPQIKSIYRWQEKIETAQEFLLLIKTRSEYYALAEQCIKSQHSYEVPEIIAIDITKGLPSYLHWITESLKKL